MMSSPFYRSASRAVRSLLSASKPSRFSSEGRAVASASALSLYGNLSSITSNYRLAGSKNASRGWLSGVLGLTAAAYMLQEQEAYAAELERTFIAIKPDGVQRGLISEIISRFERKGFKLVAIKIVVPSKEFAQKHYHDLKERPFFNGLCDFLSSGPVIAMVWEGEGVIKYGRKLIGATDPQKSEPGTIRGDLAVVVGRNIIHGSDGPETSKDEINLWFKPEELMAGKPISTEAVALTEKKMDMTLDDIIKMSKNTGTKGKKQPRVLTNKKKVLNNAVKDRSSKAQRFLDSRSSIRQGFLAQRRSHFQDNEFSLATEVARKVAVASHSNGFLGHNRVANSRTPRFGGPLGQRKAANGDFGTTLFPRQQQKQAIVSKERPQTLDSRFANMKEQRMKMLSYVSNTVRPRGNAVPHNGGFKQRLPWGRGRFAN